jgi:hypothetical protein
MTNRLLPPLAMALITLFSGTAIARSGTDGLCGVLHVDANNDGKMTFAEHEAFLRSRFATMDKTMMELIQFPGHFHQQGLDHCNHPGIGRRPRPHQVHLALKY